MNSRFFTAAEMRCKGKSCCGGVYCVSDELLQALDKLRSISGSPLIVTSGFRCYTHNKKIGGAEKSMHCIGLGADVKSDIHTPEDLCRMAMTIPAIKGIGVYNGWLHVDVRKGKRKIWRKAL